MRIGGQATVGFGIRGVVKNIDDASAANSRRIVNACFRKIVMIAKLFSASFGKVFHVVLAAEMKTASGTRLDAGRLKSFAHAICAERAFKNSLGFFIELGNVERASGDAVPAADTFVLLEINDTVGVLHDCAVGWARRETSGIGAVHALIFAHEPHQRAIFALVLVEKDQIPIVPARFRHRLVRIAEDSFAEGKIVPFHAGDFAGFAADAGGSVDQLANGVLALGVFSRHRPGVA